MLHDVNDQDNEFKAMVLSMLQVHLMSHLSAMQQTASLLSAYASQD